MKEITRRLYTKPVMLGMALLMGVALLAGLLVTTSNSSAAPPGFPILAGPTNSRPLPTAELFTTSGALDTCELLVRFLHSISSWH
jgi:hypothetical protein